MRRKSMLLEFVEAVLIALILALTIRAFIVQAYKIPSGSMESTLLVGDRLLVTKFSYGVKIPFTHKYIIQFSDPERGDVIVFEFPKDPALDYVKRIVGIPGDTIEIRNKVVFRNGEPVQEEYTQFIGRTGYNNLTNMDSIVVPEGKYFAMGDNRDDSEDSRVWGFVAREQIHGKVWRIYWSWDEKANAVRWGRLGQLIE